MTVAKNAIAAVLVLAGFVYCEWFTTWFPADRLGEAPFVWGYGIFVSFSFLTVSVLVTAILGHPLFPDSYFAAQRFEREGKIYRHTGILLLVAFFRFTGYERFWRKQIPVRKDLAALRM